MRAMVLHRAGDKLRLEKLADPEPATGQLLIEVEACGVCRTDLHIIDGDLKSPKFPLVLGHEIVGRIKAIGAGVVGFSLGTRVGVPWLGYACGSCEFCNDGHENLCDRAKFTGYDLNGGYAELCVADARFCFQLETDVSAANLAPLLCAGLIGYRSLRLAGDAKRLGIYGFGAAAHLITQVAVNEQREVYAFTRPGDKSAQNLAMELGRIAAFGSDQVPPEPLDATIIFAPVGVLVPTALRAVRKGGKVVCGGIHMSKIPAFEYELLWGERSICSVANLTRDDAIEFLELARKIPIAAKTTTFPLAMANEALELVRNGQITGAAVLVP